ncbi:hypothetical protein ACVBEQ_07045 [Nakamurella sp. GG22]
MDDNPLATDLVGKAGRLAVRMLDAGIDTYLKTSILDVVVPTADHAAAVAAATAL